MIAGFQFSFVLLSFDFFFLFLDLALGFALQFPFFRRVVPFYLLEDFFLEVFREAFVFEEFLQLGAGLEGDVRIDVVFLPTRNVLIFLRAL